MLRTLILFFSLSLPFVTFSQCKTKNLVKGCKANMSPYTYDSYIVTEINIDKNPKTIEVEFTAFAGEEYKLLCCSPGFKEAVRMDIYDKSSKSKKRNKVFDSNNGIDNLFWSFEPSKGGNYYIEYTVPPSVDGTTKSGCVVMLIGYKE